MFGRIAAGLFHDLSHPIQNLGNSARLLARDDIDPESRETFHRTIEREIATLKRFMDDLRNIAKPKPIERFAITSVLWDDGLVEGDPQLAANGRVMDAGTAMQLARAIPLLRGAADAPSEHPVHGLRAAVAGLPVVATADDARRAIETLMNPALVTVPNARSRMASGMQAAKNALLNDIDAFTRSAVAGNPSEYAAWLRAMAEKFDAWHTRIAQAPR